MTLSFERCDGIPTAKRGRGMGVAVLVFSALALRISWVLISGFKSSDRQKFMVCD